MRFLVTGSDGQLGRELMLQLGDKAIGMSRPAYSVESAADCMSRVFALMDMEPQGESCCVIHTAAFTDVDRAETEPASCYGTNVQGTKILAERCYRHNVRLVYISTDYVFGSGDAAKSRAVAESPAPTGIYGWSKYKGEIRVRQVPDHLIIRTSGLFMHGPYRNFPNALIGQIQQGKRKLTVVNDQVVAPTYVPDLARAIIWLADAPLVRDRPATGIVHVTSGGRCSWHKFAIVLLEHLGWNSLVSLSGISAREYVRGRELTTALRPRCSVLDTSKYNDWKIEAGAPPMRHWNDGVRDFCANWLHDFGHSEMNPFWKPSEE